MAVAAVALGALTIAWVVFLRAPASKPENATVALASPAVTAAPPPAPAAMIRVVLRVEPAQAALYLDGARLSSNPFSSSLPADQREHELFITADGFLPVTRSVRFETDMEIQLALDPVPAAPALAITAREGTSSTQVKAARRVSRGRHTASSSRPDAPAEAAEPAQNAAASSDACNPPYVVNALGVKRYKRECLN